MVFTEEERRERKSISAKKYYQNNKEKVLKKVSEYSKNNKEKKRIYDSTPERKKLNTIKNWKRRGLICEDYDSLYCHYLTATECDNCNITFGEKGDGSRSFKCMDHSHQTGEFRNFLCCNCNVIRE